MTDAETAAFLDEQWLMVISSNGVGGWPHMTTVMYGILDGMLAFTSFARAQKVLNLRRDPHIACLVETGQSDYQSIRGAEVFGIAEIVDDEDLTLSLVRQIRLKKARTVAQNATAAGLTERAEELVSKRVAVIVSPQRVMTWDHRLLNGRY